MGKFSRREFIGTTIAATGVIAAGAVGRGARDRSAPAGAEPGLVIDPAVKSPTDRVRLGRSGLKISLVGVGTGSVGYAHQSNQTRLGQEAFTRLMRHALDRGVNFFDLADSYGSHPFFARALRASRANATLSRPRPPAATQPPPAGTWNASSESLRPTT